jgi:hypothetical protein
MNGNITTSYYRFPPPSFEEWTSQGPRHINLHDFIEDL